MFHKGHHKYEMCNLEQELTVKIIHIPCVMHIVSPHFQDLFEKRSEPGNRSHSNSCQLLAIKYLLHVTHVGTVALIDLAII